MFMHLPWGCLAGPGYYGPMCSYRRVCVVLAVASFLTVGEIRSQNPGAMTPAQLTSDQVVEQLQSHNRARSERLKHYETLRHYKAEYKGFGKDIAAEMEVEAIFDASSGKTLRIVSQSGSKLLIDRVLKRLVESEKDAGKEQSATALTTANYKFHMAGNESLGERPAYVLDVEPLVATKYLYRGKIWVDGADFAVAKIEAEPAKGPSFWISRTKICHIYARNGGFWLPEENRTETKVRIGGTAVLTIDYGTYKLTSDMPNP